MRITKTSDKHGFNISDNKNNYGLCIKTLPNISLSIWKNKVSDIKVLNIRLFKLGVSIGVREWKLIKIKNIIIDYLVLIGIVVGVTLLWQLLELLMIGHINPNNVDSVIGLILTYSLYINYKNWKKLKFR